MIVYGIPNCDTVKKARTWLAEHGHDVVFHDVKKAGVNRSLLENWLAQQDWQILVNRKGTTWRGLPDERKAAITDAASAMALMQELPSVIKRPVLEKDGKVLAVGFSAEQYAQLFAA